MDKLQYLKSHLLDEETPLAGGGSYWISSGVMECLEFHARCSNSISHTSFLLAAKGMCV